MNAMFDSLFAWLLDFGCLATVLLTAAIVLRWLLRQPASRVMLAWGTWLAIVAGGAILAIPAWPRIDLSNWLASPAQDSPVVFVQETAPQFVTHSRSSLEPIAGPQPHTMPSAGAPTLSPADIGARAWLAAALVGCGWLLIGMLRAWRLIARSQVAPEWTRAELLRIAGRRRRMPGVLTNQQVPSALALGTLRPRIILPLASAAESNTPAVRAALAHEWAHIAAGDLWLLALERSLLPLLALHPLFWWLRRLTRLDQELAADAAAAGDKPAEYAEALLVWAKGEPHRRTGVAALAMWERPSNLSRRIQMILDPKRQSSAARRGWSAYAAIALLLTLGLGLSLVSWRPIVAQDQPQPQPTILLPATITSQTLPAPPAEKSQIMLELNLLTLDLRAIADAKVDFPISPDRPAEVSKGGLITVQLGEKEASRLVEVVLGVKGAEMLSQPQIITLDGQEASLQVGGEVPIAVVDEIVGGERRERRVESKAFGTKLRIMPRIVPEDRRMVVVEIAGEQTSLNRAWKKGDETNTAPLLSTHKIELAATVELGKTLVVLSPAAKPGGKEPQKSLLILLRPSVVEHKYVEVYPDPAAATRATAARTRYTQLVAEGTDEAQLAEQLRAIREAVEELAREREANRQENAALKAEVDRMKAQLKALPQLSPVSAPQSPLNYADPRSAAGTTPPLAGLAQLKDTQAAHPEVQTTHVFEFGSDQEAGKVAEALRQKAEELNLARHVALTVQHGRLIVTGSEDAISQLRDKDLRPVLALQHSREAANPTVPTEAVRRGLEWLRRHQDDVAVDPHRDSDRDAALAAKSATERRLLELDLQAAELELQAAQEDFEAAEKLSKRNAISAEELRNKRRLVDRTRIQLAKLKVMLEAEQEPAAPTGTLQTK